MIKEVTSIENILGLYISELREHGKYMSSGITDEISIPFLIHHFMILFVMIKNFELIFNK